MKCLQGSVRERKRCKYTMAAAAQLCFFLEQPKTFKKTRNCYQKRTISLSNGLSYYTTIQHANGEENRNCHFLMHCMSLPNKKKSRKNAFHRIIPSLQTAWIIMASKDDECNFLAERIFTSFSCPLDVLSKYTPSVCIDI